MGVKREDFFKWLLSKRTDELLFSARALVARMKEELVTRPEGPVTGVPAGIDVNKPPKSFRDAMSREDPTGVGRSIRLRIPRFPRARNTEDCPTQAGRQDVGYYTH